MTMGVFDFPAIKRNGAGIDFRLADDTAYATITASTIELGAASDTALSRSAAEWHAMAGRDHRFLSTRSA